MIKHNTRSYFEQYTSFEDKKVLDYGCGSGSFLHYKPHDNYTGVDVRADCINENKKKWPQHEWMHINSFNEMYNPQGTETLTLQSQYDICISYSVITHMRINDIVRTVDTLKQHCNNLFLSYYSNKDKFAYDTICKYRKIPNTQWEDISSNDMFYLYYGNCLWTFFADDFIADKLGAKSYSTSFPNNDYLGIQRCLVI
tara:strand:- start:267 stop:860 length:594 start_codon:yes stop_codon:yes gene_type:complete